jgi:beta-phosphoglucomutase-like phosphatase (HAD superfamily)
MKNKFIERYSTIIFDFDGVILDSNFIKKTQ